MDGISNEILKATSNIILPILVKLFNKVLTHGTYPKDWSLGIITPLHKKGSPFLTDNNRGITVTSAISKSFSIVMNTRLEKFCVNHNIINEKQASHKVSSRTSDNVFILDNLLNKNKMDLLS